MINITPSVPEDYKGPLRGFKCRLCQRKFTTTYTDYKAIRPILYCPECSQHLALVPETTLIQAASIIRVWCIEQSVDQVATSCSAILGYPAYMDAEKDAWGKKRKHLVIIPIQIPYTEGPMQYGTVIDALKALPGVISVWIDPIEHENEKKRPTPTELTRKMLRQVSMREIWKPEPFSTTVVFAYRLIEDMYELPASIIADEYFSSLVFVLEGVEHIVIPYPNDNTDILMCTECYRVFFPQDVNTSFARYAPCGHLKSDIAIVPDADESYNF